MSYLKPFVTCYGTSSENMVKMILKIEEIQWDQPVYIYGMYSFFIFTVIYYNILNFIKVTCGIFPCLA